MGDVVVGLFGIVLDDRKMVRVCSYSAYIYGCIMKLMNESLRSLFRSLQHYGYGPFMCISTWR